MQNAIVIEDNYRGVTPEERMFLRQLFDAIVKETFVTLEPAPELSSHQGGDDDIIH